MPRQDSPIERCVVAEDSLVTVVKRLQKLSDITAGVPVSRVVVDLHPYTDHLKPRVTYVRFGGHLRQAVLLVVVGFKVDGYNVHNQSSVSTSIPIPQ